MSIVAIIPARGGSKRIHNKNIKSFAGKPIIAYSIQAARQSNLFDRIIVSTDSKQIAEIAKKYGAEVPFLRPAELSDDYTATAPVIVHALKWMQQNNFTTESFCCIYATAPFLKIKYLKRGLILLKKFDAATSFSVTSFPFSIERALKIEPSRRVRMVWPEYETKRSNDLPERYHDAGQFYWGNTIKFLEEKRLYTSNSMPVILPRHRVIDIDTLEDWETAEKMFLAMKTKAEDN